MSSRRIRPFLRCETKYHSCGVIPRRGAPAEIHLPTSPTFDSGVEVLSAVGSFDPGFEAEMPRQAARSAARGPLDKLRGPVRKMAEEVFSIDTDRSVLKDEPLMNGLSELQTKQVS